MDAWCDRHKARKMNFYKHPNYGLKKEWMYHADCVAAYFKNKNKETVEIE